MGTLPTNRIRKVKLTNNTEYDLIPSMLQDGTTNNKLSVPTLSNDDTIVTTDTNQTITGMKTFIDGFKISDTEHTTTIDTGTISTNITIDLPSISGTLALTSDLPQVKRFI